MFNEKELKKLQDAKVAVFGLGGVGGTVAISLARTGIKHFLLVDKDVVVPSNINRQVVASISTLNKSKCEVMKEMILDINSDIEVETRECFFLDNEEAKIDFSKFDYVVDAIDTIKGKIALIKECQKINVPIISAMGAGKRNDITKLKVSDIYQTSVDPLSKVMRHELKKEGIKSLKVVYSLEEPLPSKEGENKVIPSLVFVPQAMGLLMAAEVVKDIVKNG